jgi:RecA/RadA recombinase
MADEIKTDPANELGIDTVAIEAELKEVVATGTNINLTEDEKQKIEENKKKRIGRPPSNLKKESSVVVPPVATVAPVNIDVAQVNTNNNNNNNNNNPPEPPKIITSAFGDIKMSENELKQCQELQNDLNVFLLDKGEIATGCGIIDTLPTGIDLLDAILGGGFGVGTLTLIVGNPGTFKSALIGQTIGTSQKKFRGKLMSSYLDSENAMTMKRLQQLGVIYPPLKPSTNVTIEDMYKTLECHCAFKELKGLTESPSIVAWDSIANTISRKERESTEDDINKFMGLRARIHSVLLPKYISKMTNYNVSLIAVNQLRDKMDVGQFAAANDMRWMGDKTMPGGLTIKYNAFHLLLLTVKGDLKFDQWGFAGVELQVKCIKNKLFTPNIPISLLVNFETGISNFWTSYKYLVDTKRMATGAWNSLVSTPEIKFRTKEALDIYNTNPTFKQSFDIQMKEAIKTEIFDKYTNYNEPEIKKEEPPNKSI